jgi:peptidoglycan/LPS O-acetylase OafA/YrhL
MVTNCGPYNSTSPSKLGAVCDLEHGDRCSHSIEGGAHILPAAISKVLCSKPAQTIGDMSYSIYLCHMLPLVLCLRSLELAHIDSPDAQAAILFIATLVGTLILSWASYRLVERPFHNFSRNLALRWLSPAEDLSGAR